MGSQYGFAFSAISVLVIGALVVAVAAAVNRLWRPGLRGPVRHETANSLRRDGRGG